MKVAKKVLIIGKEGVPPEDQMTHMTNKEDVLEAHHIKVEDNAMKVATNKEEKLTDIKVHHIKEKHKDMTVTGKEKEKQTENKICFWKL